MGTCFGDAISTVPVASGVAGMFGTRMSFILSPGDQYAATGRVELVNAVVPEPATGLLIGVGLMAALRRRYVRRDRA
jgi:hypothetical protein